MQILLSFELIFVFPNLIFYFYLFLCIYLSNFMHLNLKGKKMLPMLNHLDSHPAKIYENAVTKSPPKLTLQQRFRNVFLCL